MNKRSSHIFCTSVFPLCLFALSLCFSHERVWAQEPNLSRFGLLSPDAFLFDPYPHSLPFDAVVQQHLYPSSNSNALMVSTWFLHADPGAAMECRVDASGKGGTVRAVFNLAMECYTPLQLDAKKLEALQSSLLLLPPNSVRPPLEKLLILSYKSGNVWMTRLYDRTQLPASVQRVYKIVGASVTSANGIDPNGAALDIP